MAEVYNTCSGFVTLSEEFVTIDKKSGKHVVIPYSQVKSVGTKGKEHRRLCIIISLLVCALIMALAIPAIVDINILLQRQRHLNESEDNAYKELVQFEKDAEEYKYCELPVINIDFKLELEHIYSEYEYPYDMLNKVLDRMCNGEIFNTSMTKALLNARDEIDITKCTNYDALDFALTNAMMRTGYTFTDFSEHLLLSESDCDVDYYRLGATVYSVTQCNIQTAVETALYMDEELSEHFNNLSQIDTELYLQGYATADDMQKELLCYKLGLSKLFINGTERYYTLLYDKSNSDVYNMVMSNGYSIYNNINMCKVSNMAVVRMYIKYLVCLTIAMLIYFILLNIILKVKKRVNSSTCVIETDNAYYRIMFTTKDIARSFNNHLKEKIKNDVQSIIDREEKQDE